MRPVDPDDERARFEAFYTANVRDVLGYALRRVSLPEDAGDVVAETFLVAWRRWHEVPAGDARPWLFGVARKVLANQSRSHRRRGRLGARLGQALAAAERLPDPAVEVAERDRIRGCLAALPDADRELLTLIAWEGLTPAEAAVVLGLAPGALRMRLSRARRRFRDLYGDDPLGSGQVSSMSTYHEEER